MKKLRRTAVAAVAAFFCLQTVCGAALNIGGTYDIEAAQLTLSIDGEKNSEVTVAVMPYDLDEKSLTAASAQTDAVFYMFHTDKNGALETLTRLRENQNSGLYKAVITQGDESAQFRFTYADAAEVNTVLPQINGAASAADITTVLQSASADKLGVDEDLAQRYGVEIGKYLYGNRPSGGYTAKGFVDAYTAGLALGMVKGGANLSDVVGYFSKYLLIDPEKDYKAYTSAVQAELERLIKAAEIGTASANELYREKLLLARINKAESDVQMQSIIISNKDVLGLIMTDYQALTTDYQRLRVFTQMISSANYSSYKEVREAFSKASKAAGESSGQNPGGSFAGGGGGGGSVGGSGSAVGEVYGNVTNTVSNGSAAAERFSDMKGHWARETVYSLAKAGVINGYPDGSFLPEEKVTRAEFSKMICAALKLGSSDFKEEYADVKSSDWFAPYIGSLSEKEIVNGFGGSFRPNALISRQDAAVIAWRALKYCGGKSGETGTFDDFAEISEYAKEAVANMAGLGIIQGYNGRFSSMNNTTRAEAAQILRNVMQALGKV